MPDPSNLQPEFKYFSAEVFTNVYDGVNQIKMPKSLMILGFSNDKDAAIPVRHDNYIFRREVLRDLLAFCGSPTVTRFSLPVRPEAERQASSMRFAPD